MDFYGDDIDSLLRQDDVDDLNENIRDENVDEENDEDGEKKADSEPVKVEPKKRAVRNPQVSDPSVVLVFPKLNLMEIPLRFRFA